MAAFGKRTLQLIEELERSISTVSIDTQNGQAAYAQGWNDALEALKRRIHTRAQSAVLRDQVRIQKFVLRAVQDKTLRGALSDRSRRRSSVEARHTACWLLRQMNYSYPQIGRWMNLHHTSVMHAVDRVEQRRVADRTLRASLDALHQEIRGASQDPSGQA